MKLISEFNDQKLEVITEEKDGKKKYIITGWYESMGKDEIGREFQSDYFI